MNQNDTGVKTVLARMKTIYGVEKDAELARALDISPQTLSSWRQRSAIPYSLCVECAKRRGASLDWLLYGEGQMTRDVKNGTNSAADSDGTVVQQDDVRTKILGVLEGLTTEDLEDILSEAAHRKRLRTLEQRFENLQSQFFGDEKQAV